MSNIDKQALRKLATDAHELGIIKRYTKGIEANKRFAATATPLTFLALLDELEAEKNMREAAEKRIAEIIEYYSKRIARLKARSISLTLPPRKTFDDYINDEFDASDLAAIYNACRLECEVKFKDACRAAGIGVKGE
ncbi:hypothetical protein ACVEU5_000600 [Citrobacter koseri]